MTARWLRPMVLFWVPIMLLVCGSGPLMVQESGELWRRARLGRVLTFPADHASHPDYRIEWWYYTGNLKATDGRRFGYQVTFFRVGVDREPENPSPWAVRDLFMTHVAVTDIEGGQHLFDERLNRAGVGWAGARTDRLEVWNEDWRLGSDGEDHLISVASREAGFRLDLRLAASQVPVLHGMDGFSQKGSEPGNASHYYSLTRMDTTGALHLSDETLDVRGFSWMDHEFGSSFLEPAQQGWDWFSLQLDDGTDLMVYVLRRQDGQVDSHSGGTVVAPDGTTTRLGPDEFRLESGRVWVSSTSGARYPVEWQVDIPTLSLELDVRAALDAQELHTENSIGVTYWEGAVTVNGRGVGPPVAGRGYLEMTGYVGRPMSEVLR